MLVILSIVSWLNFLLYLVLKSSTLFSKIYSENFILFLFNKYKLVFIFKLSTIYSFIINKLKFKFMGCGCKGKQQPAPAPSTQTSQSGQTQKPVVNETIKQSIKKTIEKYYSVSKSSQ
jgi:hypothetical protein